MKNIFMLLNPQSKNTEMHTLEKDKPESQHMTKPNTTGIPLSNPPAPMGAKVGGCLQMSRSIEPQKLKNQGLSVKLKISPVKTHLIFSFF